MSFDLLSVLSLASSQSDASAVQHAQNALQQAETTKGFYQALMDVVLNLNLDTSVRWQAVLYLKNGMDRYWRKHANNAICEEEKENIRRKLLVTVNEPVQPIALQIAVVIGKAARFDIPNSWNELFPSLLTSLQSTHDLEQHRSLLFLYHVIKALSSKRLAADRRTFREMATQLLPFVLNVWQRHHGDLVQKASVGNESCLIPLEKATLCMKILRKAIVQGLRKPHEYNDVIIFLNSLYEQTKTTLKFRLTFPQYHDQFDKYCVLHLKIYTDLLDLHPFSFIPFLRKTLEFVCEMCFTEEGSKLLFQRFTIFSLNLVKQVLLCAEYKLPKNMRDLPESSPNLEGHQIKLSFFTASTTIEICKRLVSQYMPISQEDLENWEADPEDYVCEDGGDSWKYSYRPCCESTFLTLFHEFRETLAPILVELLRDVCSSNENQQLEMVLRKEAVYNAVGLAAFDLYDEINFDQWLLSGLESELSVKTSNYRIVRRRAVWLIGQWSGVKLSPQLRPRLYQIILPLLDPSEDLVVRLSAAKALKVVIDDFEFSTEELQPYLANAFQQIFYLLKEVRECDTKLSVLNVLSYLIERVGTSIRPFIQELVNYLPALWDASEDHNMLRCSILTSLVYIVQGLGTISTNLSPFLYPVIHLSTDLTNQSSVYLLEDGLELWLTVLHNTKQISQELMALANNIKPILELGSENLRTMLYILQGYVLLAPQEFLHQAGEMVNATLQDQYGDLQDEGVLMILRLVELVVKVGPSQTPKLFHSLILCSIRAIHDGDDYPMLMSLHLSIASRILLASPNEFNTFTVELAQELAKNQQEVAGRVLDVWLDKMCCVTQPDRRKLLSLALSSLLSSSSPVVYQRVFAIFTNITETLNDILKKDEDTGNIIDTLMKTLEDLSAEGVDDIDYETEHDVRKRQFNSQDPIHTVDLRKYFEEQLVAFSNCVGRTKYIEVMENVDVETRDNMKEFVAI